MGHTVNRLLRLRVPRSVRLAAVLTAALAAGCSDDEPLSLLEGRDADIRADVEVAGDSRPALVPPLSSELAFELTVPANPRLSFSFALASPRRAPRARVDFRVRVVSDEIPVTVFRRTLTGEIGEFDALIAGQGKS